MFRKKRYVMVCINERAPNDPKGCCVTVGAVPLRDRLKELLEQKGLKGRARILGTSCLDVCENGPVLCVMPDNVWYGGVRIEDAEEIVDSHLDKGVPVERLILPDAPEGLSLM